MGIMMGQVVIPRDNGLPRDAVVHTFNFLTFGEATTEHAEDAVPAIEDFYNAAGATSGSIVASYLAGHLNAAGARFKAYDLAAAEPRAPLYDELISITPNASTNHLPAEVALCLSLDAATVSGVARGRTRGRIYLGPFSQGAIGSTGTTDDGRPLQALREAAVDAGKRLMDGASFGTLSEGLQWAIVSQTGTTAARPVVRVWCDDAWDTQRRRGARSTGRYVRDAA